MIPMVFPHEQPVEPEAASIDRSRLSKVVTHFLHQQATGAFPGGQLAVRRGGQLLVDEACGIARGRGSEGETARVAVHTRTPFRALSAGKPLAAVAIAMLEDRGRLDPNAPVASIIPEFEAHGKGEITVLDVLTHRAGILLPDLVATPERWGDRHAVLHELIEAKPAHRRGTFAYMPYEYGWILSEIVLRVDGRTMDEFVTAEISKPLGLPDLCLGLAGRALRSVAWSYWLGRKKLFVGRVDVAADFEARNNSMTQLDSLNPAVSLVTDAASLAAFYEFLLAGGVTNTGRRLLSSDTLKRYTTRNFVGWERTARAFSAVGRGFLVGAWFTTVFGWWGSAGCFGHPGGLSCLAFGDHRTGLSAAIVTNGNRSFFDLANRFVPLVTGLRKACH
jgi:CubicO group peptidase (beta-lactamase class C family)